MAFSILGDKTVEPTDEQLFEVLGNAFPLWEQIIRYVDEKHGLSEAVWRFTGEKWGWNLRVIRKKRNILYFTPQQEYFINGFVFGGKAILAAEESDLPLYIMDTIHNAPKYAEGTGFRVEVRTREDAAVIQKLIDIKIAH